MKRAFTLIELVVAVAILAIMASFAGAVFKVGIESYRVSGANAEIMRNLRAITDQLNADFKGLRKDGEIFVAWSAVPVAELRDIVEDPCAYADDLDQHVRFDRIMFFANGDFHTYGRQPLDEPSTFVRGNVAWISYMLVKRELGIEYIRPQEQLRYERILARTQHVLTADDTLTLDYLDPNRITWDFIWTVWHNKLEYERTAFEEWLQIPWSQKARMLAAITDVVTDSTVPQIYALGTQIMHPTNPGTVHNLLCQGVGEFMVQGWLEKEQRWFPEVDRNYNGILTDPPGTDFILSGGVADSDRPMWVLYPFIRDPDIPDPTRGREDSMIRIGDGAGGELKDDTYLRGLATEANFNRMPGLGRALKFTFTLYDSRGIIEGGRTFTHIVYLDD